MCHLSYVVPSEIDLHRLNTVFQWCWAKILENSVTLGVGMLRPLP